MSFSTANLSVVAYALVKADGTSPEINSGVKTSLVDIYEGSYYNLVLPGNENVAKTTTLQQGQGDPKTKFRKDLIFVTPIGDTPQETATFDTDEFTKQINIQGNACDFAVMILRPTIPTPTDSDGIENGPT